MKLGRHYLMQQLVVNVSGLWCCVNC